MLRVKFQTSSWSRWICLFCLCVGSFLRASAQPADNAAVLQLLDDQKLSCLFLIGTSTEMGRREAKTGVILENWLASGLGGQMKEGDHFAIVGYSKNGYQVLLPPTVWAKADSAMEGKSARESLRSLRYEGSMGWANVAPLFSMLMSQPRTMNTLILSDGIEPFYGTQWDTEIQAAMAAQRVNAASQKSPVILRLTGGASVFSSWSVSGAGAAVQFAPVVKAAVAVPPSTTPKKVSPVVAEKQLVSAKAVGIQMIKPPQTQPNIEVARLITPSVLPVAVVPAAPVVHEPRKIETQPAASAILIPMPPPQQLTQVAREFAVDPKPKVEASPEPAKVDLVQPVPEPPKPVQVIAQPIARIPLEASVVVAPQTDSSLWPWVPALVLPVVGFWFYGKNRRAGVRASLISQSYRQ